MTTVDAGPLRPAAIAIFTAGAVALAGGIMTQSGAAWAHTLLQPAWQPPGWLFGPVWTLLFVMIMLSFITAWDRAPGRAARRKVAALFAVNGFLNVAWSGLFFWMRRPDFAVCDVVLLWLSIALMIAALGRVSKRAGWLLVPYLCWVSFAIVLNVTLVRLNAPFG